MLKRKAFILFLGALCVLPLYAQAMAASAVVHPGLRYLQTGIYQEHLMSEREYLDLWKTWEPALRTAYEQASPEERKSMYNRRYGLFEMPGMVSEYPLALTKGEGGRLHFNCFLCHAGKIRGEVVLGAPNNQLDLATLWEDMATIKMWNMHLPASKRPFDLGFLHIKMPAGFTRGTTNSFVMSAKHLALRNPNLDRAPLKFIRPQPMGKLINHDIDVPPWWLMREKQRLYADGFVEKNARSFMQFMMGPRFAGNTIREALPKFEQVLAWTETLQAPVYLGHIDRTIVERGKSLFAGFCASCHGNTQDGKAFPNLVVPIESVGTDPLRLIGLTPEFRAYYKESWLGDFGKLDVTVAPRGYIAQPLTGIWASAPYFHNGSVPTLYHVLNPEKRPNVWRVTDYDAYDDERVGLQVEEFRAVPEAVTDIVERRNYIDAKIPSKDNAGHTYGQDLSGDDKRALLEYLKTL